MYSRSYKRAVWLISKYSIKKITFKCFLLCLQRSLIWTNLNGKYYNLLVVLVPLLKDLAVKDLGVTAASCLAFLIQFSDCCFVYIWISDCVFKAAAGCVHSPHTDTLKQLSCWPACKTLPWMAKKKETLAVATLQRPKAGNRFFFLYCSFFSRLQIFFSDASLRLNKTINPSSDKRCNSPVVKIPPNLFLCKKNILTFMIFLVNYRNRFCFNCHWLHR